jgi:3,4-dihydroxy 2-butanone 4-phosphate synthase/GTP cyclohydrolase II
MGDIQEDEPCLVRVQTLNTLRDIIGTIRPGFKKSWSLAESMARIAKEGKGVVVIVDQDPSKAEELEQMRWYPEMPPIQRVNTESGVFRVIGTGSQILRDLGVGKMRVLSTPTRYNALSGFSLEVVEFLENDE